MLWKRPYLYLFMITTTASTEQTFLQNFLEILKRKLARYCIYTANAVPREFFL